MAKQASRGRGNIDPRKRGQGPAASKTELLLTPEAETAYLRFYERADNARRRGDSPSQHCATLNVIDDLLENVISRDPYNQQFALSGSLSTLYSN